MIFPGLWKWSLGSWIHLLWKRFFGGGWLCLLRKQPVRKTMFSFLMSSLPEKIVLPFPGGLFRESRLRLFGSSLVGKQSSVGTCYGFLRAALRSSVSGGGTIPDENHLSRAASQSRCCPVGMPSKPQSSEFAPNEQWDSL